MKGKRLILALASTLLLSAPVLGDVKDTDLENKVGDEQKTEQPSVRLSYIDGAASLNAGGKRTGERSRALLVQSTAPAGLNFMLYGGEGYDNPYMHKTAFMEIGSSPAISIRKGKLEFFISPVAVGSYLGTSSEGCTGYKAIYGMGAGSQAGVMYRFKNGAELQIGTAYRNSLLEHGPVDRMRIMSLSVRFVF